ncbi:ABC-three component system protein [Labilibaculum euxinus]|uniref:ABC-three component systems C-terminal domain-containing protein n=1 Tax=Labilibaculum euxinus TaxID=2686357 RepID=A0A7M4DB22_9BACT|nr:ABC-three component system protein [Labilibaculum euxinus]MUP39851.1 hypothetical protein [Labilibaculum euxinus]MVB09056.1 hypothetical protein [Labilibaculum euxinus]
MNKDDLKQYSVMVGGGSGCLLQPMTDDYTYILTAKHLFFESKLDEQGQDYDVQFSNGTKIDIKKCVKTQTGWDAEPIPFVLQEGETYFPHKEADIAILKIVPAITGFENIGIEEVFAEPNYYELCGFPSNVEQTREYTTHKIENLIVSNGYFYSARLFGSLRQIDIEGMSGCGILRVVNDNISIIGIQSKMGSQIFPAGEIGFVQINHFNEIVEYKEHTGKLSKLHPPYLKKFDFLLNDCFVLEVDSIDESKIENARTTLRNKAYEITKSDITPIGITELFKERLLINENDSYCLSHKKVWISWLEFLVIMNLMKYEILTSENLSDIFNSYRLKYSNADEWTEIFRGDLLTSDYVGLKEDSTVVVNTRNAPKTNRHLIIPKGTMPKNIGKVYDKRGFRADIGVDPYTSFCFVHLDYFKTKCIIEKLDEYENLSEVQLLEKIKMEYHELFS